MIRFFGAALLSLGGWLLGRCCAAQLAERERTAELLLRELPLLRSRILDYALPMPTVLEQLEREERFPLRAYEPLPTEADFTQRWVHFASSLSTGREGQESVAELGLAISAGADPEQALRFCEERLERCRQELERKRRESGRLYPALGCCAGVLLSLLLL